METRVRRFRAPLLIGSCATLLIVSGEVTRAADDRDTQEISHYALTEAGLAKYSTATQNLSRLGKSGQLNCDDESESPSSLDKFVAKIDATPAAKAALQSAGMSSREYVVFSMSLLQNGLALWATEQPGGKLPPNVSKANVDFVRAHKAAIEKLDTGKKDKCGDSGDERDSGSDSDSGDDRGSEQ